MFDPTVIIASGKFGYIMRHEGCDYHVKPPLKVRLNPLRLEVGIGRTRPCRVILNDNAWMHRKWSNFNWWLWKRRYRKIFGREGQTP